MRVIPPEPPSSSAGATSYVGRFAPSPSGPLHFGSLVTAVGSYLDARSVGGQWLLRIDDLDRARNIAGAGDQVLTVLEAFGFEWDGAVIHQSARLPRYAEALERLRASGLAFACSCSRRELADSTLAHDGARLYPGTCRVNPARARTAYAWRVRVTGTISFDDLIQSAQHQNLASEVGDFVVQRADGQFAYQLAVVIDDHDAGITHVMRGADLLYSTGRQIYLQRSLGLNTPAYAHLPVVVNKAGEKLSKQTGATAIDPARPSPALTRALCFLGHPPPADVANATIEQLWQWAIKNWNRSRIPRALKAQGASL